MESIHSVFFAFVFLCLVHLLLVPEMFLQGPFVGACASSFLFLLPSLYHHTQADLAEPKSSTLYGYMTIVTIFQMLLWVYLYQQTKHPLLQYHSFAHGILVSLLIGITFVLITQVRNDDVSSKKLFVRELLLFFVFLSLLSFCYMHLLTGTLLERKYAAMFVRTYHPDSYLNPSSWYVSLKFLVQLFFIIGYLGSCITGSLLLYHQSHRVQLQG
jgi:hypothetical protein